MPPEKLPLTSDAASFQSYRTNHQVQAWRGNDLPSINWSWEESSVGFVPVRMSQSAAPESLLRTIKCNCGGRCDKRNCTCRKNGLHCISACGQCQDISCLNALQVETEEENDDN